MLHVSWAAACLLGLACLGAAWAQPKPRPTPAAKGAQAAPAEAPRVGNAVRGQTKADDERCMECHGLKGQGAEHGNGPEGKFAKLMGQHSDYLTKQLNDFRSGRRKHDVMQMMARSVAPDDLLDIVAYFAAQPRMQGDGEGQHPIGQRLYTQGDPARQIAPCASCHGEAGARASAGGPLVPLLGGQEWRYLEQQLLDFKRGLRNNSANGAMNQATQLLSEQEIAELASYLSSARSAP